MAMSLAASDPVSSTQHVASNFTRSCVNFHPSMWGDTFLQYDSESLVSYLIIYAVFMYIKFN